METLMFKKYVDDVDLILKALKVGSRLNEDMTNIEWSEETEKEDTDKGISQGEVTLNVFQKIANSFAENMSKIINLPTF